MWKFLSMTVPSVGTRPWYLVDRAWLGKAGSVTRCFTCLLNGEKPLRTHFHHLSTSELFYRVLNLWPTLIKHEREIQELERKAQKFWWSLESSNGEELYRSVSSKEKAELDHRCPVAAAIWSVSHSVVSLLHRGNIEHGESCTLVVRGFWQGFWWQKNPIHGKSGFISSAVHETTYFW